MKIFIILLTFLIPTLSGAESTISCHCFQDRSFNHQNTTAADPYFLATTQNSFLALLYNIDKRNIVKTKMGGEDGTYLWILFDVAMRSGKSIQQIKTKYNINKTWENTIAQIDFLDPAPEQLYLHLASNPENLADYIINLQLIKHFGVPAPAINQWRKVGMTRKELILAVFLGGNPTTNYNQVTSGATSWGKLLFEQGLLDGDSINNELKRRLIQI